MKAGESPQPRPMRTNILPILLGSMLFTGLAGSAEQPWQGTTSSMGPEEVVVTALKRPENIQRVPISITVLQVPTIAAQGISNLDAVSRFAPGLTMSTVGSGFVSYTYIRGGGTNQADPGSDPSVALFVDEVYVPGAAGRQFALFDLERIEVLKGPQGTLFGRNAASGALSITTKKPSSIFGVDLAAEYGTHDAIHGHAAATGPLSRSGKWAYRIAASGKARNSFTENLTGGEDPGELNTFGGRAQLQYASDSLTALVSAERFQGRNGATNQFLTGDKTGILSAASVAALPSDEQFYRHYYDVEGFENQDTWSTTGRIDWETRLGTLTWLSAYRSSVFDRVQDQDATLASGMTLSTYENNRSFSQELRFAKELQRLHLLAGAYYYEDDTRFNYRLDAGSDFTSAAVIGNFALDESELTAESYAIFANLVLDLATGLSLTTGLRYTDDRKRQRRFVKGFLAAPYVVNPAGNWSSVDPSVAVSYQVRDDVLLYASYRRGYKSGGFQTILPATAANADTPFAPERVNSRELGFKGSWIDERLVLNLALFETEMVNQQISRLIGPTAISIDNAGETRTDGLDFALAAQLDEAIRIDANLTYQRARFRRYQNGASSYAGNHQLRSPDLMGYIGAEYSLPFTRYRVTFRGDYSYQSEMFFDARNTRAVGLFQPAYAIVNAQFSLVPSAHNLEFTVWCRNLGDTRYYRNVATGGVTGLATPGDPRTYGVSVRATLP
jgi:iron complex outermembrane recepter protein